MYRIIFLLQFLFLIGGIVYTGGETVPTSVSIIVSISFLVMAVIQAILDKSIYSKIIAVVSGVYLVGNLVLANILPFGLMVGMGIYFVAQAVTIFCFAKTSKELKKPFINISFVAGTIIYSILVTIAWWIFFEPTKNSEPLIFIALVYGIWLSVMAASGLSLFYSDRRYIFTAIGSFVFVVSDFVAGIADIAGKHVPYKVNIVWITYVIAIGGIIYSKNLLANRKKS
ncbi:lysoplasmalogenase family protein [Pseudobacteroides cellulosolvens]|uniref:YhhN family protein n=1 Tax=Pseudobacteroides cellulosolvens ATCC 35603 = DSM 2933 TaxID=398512 RepID=A0A0L6JSU5_9FIRM|nr:lysoplasmalogenase family protein [Pseudobacteroides cellulosolvens]KNY28497.1 YhhN family protein [Pseudobacteroides cellulosolvens ATCC 35603 = DSM 2933]